MYFGRMRNKCGVEKFGVCFCGVCFNQLKVGFVGFGMGYFFIRVLFVE